MSISKWTVCAAASVALIAELAIAAPVVQWNHRPTGDGVGTDWSSAGVAPGDVGIGGPSGSDYANTSNNNMANGATVALVVGLVNSGFGGFDALKDGGIVDSAGLNGNTAVLTMDGNAMARLMMDLQQPVMINEVRTFTGHFWGPGSGRVNQKYDLYGSNSFSGTSDPIATNEGWTLIANVHTGAFVFDGWAGVNITDTTGTLGTYQYLMMDVFRAGTANDHPFFMEWDVLGEAVVIPEPSGLCLLGIGLVGLMRVRRSKRS